MLTVLGSELTASPSISMTGWLEERQQAEGRQCPLQVLWRGRAQLRLLNMQGARHRGAFGPPKSEGRPVSMPSGIDAALKSLKADANIPQPTKVNYNGFEPEKKKKPEVSEVTIDPAELGLDSGLRVSPTSGSNTELSNSCDLCLGKAFRISLFGEERDNKLGHADMLSLFVAGTAAIAQEKCQKIVKEQEFKIRKLKEKMAGIAPTKKNKAEINAVKEQIEELQADGNYRAAMSFVRKAEEEERDRRRAEREKDDEEALVGGGLGKKKGPSEPAPKKAAAASTEADAAASADFDADAEVVAVVKSAAEGSEEALAQLQKGAGAGSYKSAIKHEVASMAFGAEELISAKMKRAPTRDSALKTVRALQWNPGATLPALPALLLLLEETKLKSEPGGTAVDLCRVVCRCGPRSSAVPEMIFPVLLAHLGAAAAGKWKVKVAVLQLLRDLLQIVGASVNLIADPVLLQPYLQELMPLLQECLLHPTVGVQHEAAKSFGSLAFGLPEICDKDMMPFLLETLKSQDQNEDVSEVERRGAARGLAEVLLARRDLLPGCLHEVVLPRIPSGGTLECKAGGLQLVQAIASLGPQAFLPHLKRCLPFVLNALQEESEVVHKQAVAAVKTLIEEYGATAPHLLLPRMQEALFFQEEEPRTRAMDLMDCLSPFHRHSLLVSIFIARTDDHHDVRRMATLLWKEKLQSGPKAKAEVLPLLLAVLKALQQGTPTQKKAAEQCLKELEAGEKSGFEAVEPQVGAAGVLFAQDANDIETLESECKAADVAPRPALRPQLLQQRCKAEMPSFAAPLRKYISSVLSRTREGAEAAIEEELRPLADKPLLERTGSAIAAFELKAFLEKDESLEEHRSGRSSDSLIFLDGLRMMYGGGHMLLKDALLDLRKGRRYGVVGRNGAGKTTLMSTIAAGGVSGMTADVKTLHVKPEVLVEASDLNAVQFCWKELKNQEVEDDEMQAALTKVGFPQSMQSKSVNELSGGWRMKLLLASAMMRDCDILLLDEPTNHLDPGETDVRLRRYSAKRTLDYFEGNFDAFRKARRISSDEEAEAILLGRHNFDNDVDPEEVEEHKASGGVSAAVFDKSSKISFPIPGTLKGHSAAKPVMELKSLGQHSTFELSHVLGRRNVFFSYDDEGPMILKDISCKIGLTSRVGIVGANGAGKSTLLNVLCGELVPVPGPGGEAPGEVYKHRNLRLAYIAQQHMFHLAEFMNSTPYVYIQKRYQNGYDEALQRRLMEPPNEEVAKRRSDLAREYGKYGFEVGSIQSRVVRGNEVLYEVQWKGCDDPKQNTFENLSKLKKLDQIGLAKAYDERIAAQTAGIDQRPLTQKEIVKHLEQFGLDEDMILHREIDRKPHIIALDEPTNYIDMETLDALVQGLARYKGGIIVISHASEFIPRRAVRAQDFNQGKAQQRYNEVCRHEEVLQVLEQPAPLGYERMVASRLLLASDPITIADDREFLWREWAALLPTEDGGQLYVSVAMTPSPEEEAAILPPNDKFVRGHLHLAATLARQEPGSAEVSAASVIMGDVRGLELTRLDLSVTVAKPAAWWSAMGTALAAHCCASEEDGLDERGIKMKKDVAFVTIPLDGKSMVENLQGHWYRQGDNKHVGEINGSHLLWNPQWGLRDVFSKLSESETGLLEVKMEGEIRYATVSGPPYSIMWADGDIWVRR
eukprot:g3335.t1